VSRLLTIGKRRPLLLQGAPPGIQRIQEVKNTGGNVTHTSQAATWSKNTVTGNYLIALFCWSGNPGAWGTLPTGWAPLGSNFNPAGVSCGILNAVNAASQTGAQTFNWTNSVKSGIIMMEYQGVLSSGPQDGTNVTNSGATTTPTTGSATTTFAVDLLIGLVCQQNNNDAVTPTFSAPTNKFTLVDQTSFGIDPAVIYGMGALEKVVTVTGSYSGAVTSTDANGWASILVGVKGYAAPLPPTGGPFPFFRDNEMAGHMKSMGM
jgi:hypothetical protein